MAKKVVYFLLFQGVFLDLIMLTLMPLLGVTTALDQIQYANATVSLYDAQSRKPQSYLIPKATNSGLWFNTAMGAMRTTAALFPDEQGCAAHPLLLSVALSHISQSVCTLLRCVQCLVLWHGLDAHRGSTFGAQRADTRPARCDCECEAAHGGNHARSRHGAGSFCLDGHEHAQGQGSVISIQQGPCSHKPRRRTKSIKANECDAASRLPAAKSRCGDAWPVLLPVAGSHPTRRRNWGFVIANSAQTQCLW